MILLSSFNPNEVVTTLREEIANYPTFLRSFLTFGVNRYRGTSNVCGEIGKYTFELRSRNDPNYSYRAFGKISRGQSGSKLEIYFRKPKFPFYLFSFNREKIDKQTIIEFLKINLRAKIS